MKVCFFDYSVNLGGAQKGSLHLLKRLKDKGCDAYVIDPYGKNTRYKEQAQAYGLSYAVLHQTAKRTYIGGSGANRILKLLLQVPSFLMIFYKLIFLFKKIKPDFVIVNNRKALFTVLPFKRVFGFKILLYFREEGENLNKNFINKVKSRVDIVVTHSKKSQSNLQRQLGKPIHYINNCIDFDARGIMINSDYPKGENFSLLLAAARPSKEKGHDVAVKAVSALKREGILVDLVIPGEVAAGHNTDFFINLQKMTEELDVADLVHFVGWRSNFLGDVKQADAILLPSHTEGFPRVIIEAMLLGVPVCATPVGGIPEAVNHLETGLLFEVDNVEQLCDCVKLLVSNNSLRKKLSERAQIFAKQNFAPHKNTNKILSLLHEAI